MIVGFDTSNYTTSVATYDNGIMCQEKQILMVKTGERGLRQSDAVFQHTVNIPLLIDKLDFSNITAIGVSTRPRNVQGSYMPCFLVGRTVAQSVSKIGNVPVFETSHQTGHILAALYSCNRLDLIDKPFVAFHLSGGTTEVLLVQPDSEEIINADIISQSTDLKAGQAVDRTGVLLGLNFPCGAELDRLAEKSKKDFRVKPSMLGMNCSLSGVENKVKKMIAAHENKEDIASFALNYVAQTVLAMLDAVYEKYGQLPVVFSGGVSSNRILRNTILNKYDTCFAEPAFSLDNAAGTAIYAYLKSRKL